MDPAKPETSETRNTMLRDFNWNGGTHGSTFLSGSRQSSTLPSLSHLDLSTGDGGLQAESTAMAHSTNALLTRPASSFGGGNSSGGLLSSSLNDEWQRTTLNRMRERATQLVEEQRALRETQDRVQDLEAQVQTKQQEHDQLKADHSRQQLKRYTTLDEYHRTLGKIQKEEERSEKLQRGIARLKQGIEHEEERQENLMGMHHQGGSEGAGAGSFSMHTSHQRLYTQALQIRIEAQEFDRQKRQTRLEWLNKELERMQSQQQPQAQTELEYLEQQARSTQQETANLIQTVVPNLANTVRETLAQRGQLRQDLKHAQEEHDQAQAIMDEAERHYLERTKTSS